MMIQRSFVIEPNQETRIRRALKSKKGCRIKVKKCAGGNGELLVTPEHLVKYGKASNGSVVGLPFKHEELKENMKHKGGFLPLIAAALAPIIGGVAGGLIEKEIAGSGVNIGRFGRTKPWWHGGKVEKPKQLFTIEKRGNGMFLNPWVPPVHM